MSKKEEEEYLEYKLVLMGAGGSGKSCITNMFLSGYFTDAYDPTIEDSYIKKTCVDGEIGVLDILDTAGQEEYSAMMDDYMRNGQGFICVYSITDRASFEAVVKYRNKLYAVKDKDLTEYIPFVLVGNKCDLEDKRQITTAQAKLVAEQWKCPFLETSAKNNINVTEVFHEIVREIRKDRNVKGYQLKKSKGPDESMTKKIMSKFAKWGALKESVTKLFNKVSRSFSKDKVDKKGAGSSNPSSSPSSHTSTPSSPPPSSNSATVTSTPTSPTPTNSYTPVSSTPVTYPSPSYTQSNPDPPQMFTLPEPEPEPVEDPFDAQTTKDIDDWLKDLDDTEKKTYGGTTTTNTTPSPYTPSPTPTNTQPAPKSTQPSPKMSTQPAPKSTMQPSTGGVKMTTQPMQPQGQQPGGNKRPPPGAQPIFGAQTTHILHKGPAPSPNANPNPNPNPTSRPQPTPSNNQSPQPSFNPKPAVKMDKKDEFKKYPYFFANMSGSEADGALAGQPLGTFIMRFSSQPNHLAVSYVLNNEGGINRVLIGYDTDHVWMADEPEKFNTLDELVHAYRNVLLHPYTPASNPTQHYRGIPNLVNK